MENLRRLSEKSGPILTHWWTKVHEISDDDCMRPLEALYFPARCPIVCHVLLTRYSPLSLPVVQTEQIGSQLFWEDNPDFRTAYCYCDLLFTVGRSLAMN